MIEIHTIWDKIGFGLQNRAVYNIMLLGSEKMSGNISNVKKEVTFDDVYANREIRSLIEASNDVLSAMSYTEHGLRHAMNVSKTTYEILSKLEYDERTRELGRIAGYVHDIGNAVNRFNHGVTGGALLFPILRDMGMDIVEIGKILSAVGNHEEEIGAIISEISAALVIADKSDAHRTRVKKGSYDKQDIHDRVNYSIKKNILEIDPEKRLITSKYYMDSTSSVMEYLTIYLKRMTMSEHASSYLNCRFRLMINDSYINER